MPIVQGVLKSVIPRYPNSWQAVRFWATLVIAQPVRNTFSGSQHSAVLLQRTALLLLLIGCLTACKGRVELINSVSEGEANEALSVLLEGGIKATKLPGKEGMVSLDVSEDEVAKAIAILRIEGLPRERYAKMGEVFRKEGLISSPLEERARYIWALSQEISATVSQIDGVIKARVHVVLPERSAGGDPSLPSSAAVFIKHKAGINLDESVPQIKRLVANSIPGLSGEKVSVILIASTGHDSSSNTKQISAGTADTGSEQLVKPPENTSLTANGGLLDLFQQSPQLIWVGLGLLITLLSVVGYLLLRQWRKYKQEPSSPPAALNPVEE